MNSIVRYAFYTYIPMLLIAVIWDLVGDYGYWRQLVGTGVKAVVIGIAVGLALVVLTRLASYIPAVSNMEQIFRELLGPLTLAQAFLLAFLSGIAEEYLFRATVQEYLGWFTAGVLFGLVHAPFRKELWPWTLFAVLVGLLFGYIQHVTGNLTIVVMAHFTVNFINLAYLGKMPVHPKDKEDPFLTVMTE